MINPTEDDIGRSVIYVPNHADGINHPDSQLGRIKSFNGNYVFVLYHSGDTAAATLRENLEWN